MRSLNQLLLSSVSLSRFSVTWGSAIVRSKELYVTIGQSVVRHSEISSFIWFLEQLVELEREMQADKITGLKEFKDSSKPVFLFYLVRTRCPHSRLADRTSPRPTFRCQ